MEEIYKDVVGYEGLYQVSNMGNVYGIKRKNILSPDIDRGYYRVRLSKDGKKIAYSVHRLVAQAFIPNPNNYPCVNHKDENPSNNCVDNLEWCDYKYNNNYGRHPQAATEHLKKKVEQWSLDGQFICTYNSLAEAEQATGALSTNIAKCCRGKIKTSQGYKWKYVDET